MADQWYVRVRGKQSGPFSAAELKALACSGRLLPDHQVRQGAHGQWLGARRVKGLFARVAGVAPKPEAPKPAKVPLESVGESASGAAPTARHAAAPQHRSVNPPARQPSGAFSLADELEPRAALAADRPAVQIETAAGSLARTRIAGGRSDRTVEVLRLAIISLMLGVVGLCFCMVPLVPIVLAVGAGLLAVRALGLVAQARKTAKMLALLAMLISVVAGGLGVYTTLGTDHPLDRLRAMFPVSSPRPPDSDDWYNAALEAVMEGSVQVTVTEASIGQYRAAAGNAATSGEDYLFITLILENQGEKEKADYFSWSEAVDQRGDVPKLVDDAGNEYFPISFGRPLAEQTGFTSLYAGDKVRDLLVFQRPVASFSYLHLSLPARALGGTGQIQFELPHGFVQILSRKAPAKRGDRQADTAQPPSKHNPLETIEIKREPEDAQEQPADADGDAPDGADADGAEVDDGAVDAVEPDDPTSKSPAAERDNPQ